MTNHTTAARISENIDTATTFCHTPENERATYTAQITSSKVVYFEDDHARLTHDLEVTRTTSRSVKTFTVKVHRDFGRGDATRTTVYNDNGNKVYSKQFDNYRAAALHAVSCAEADLSAAPAAPAPAVETLSPAVSAPARLPEDRTDVSPEEAALEATIIEYVDVTPSPEANAPAEEIVSVGDTEPDAPDLPGTPSAAEEDYTLPAKHLAEAALARRDYLDLLSGPVIPGRTATAAQRRYKRAMAAYMASATRAAHSDLHHLRMRAEAGDLDGLRAARESLRDAGLLPPRDA